MVRCEDCGQEMLKAKTCTFPYIIDRDGKVYKRNTTYFDKGTNCHDCGILNRRGNIHHFGCDIERCPKCKKQLISCGCFEGGGVSKYKGGSKYLKFNFPNMRKG